MEGFSYTQGNKEAYNQNRISAKSKQSYSSANLKKRFALTGF